MYVGVPGTPARLPPHLPLSPHPHPPQPLKGVKCLGGVAVWGCPWASPTDVPCSPLTPKQTGAQRGGLSATDGHVRIQKRQTIACAPSRASISPLHLPGPLPDLEGQSDVEAKGKAEAKVEIEAEVECAAKAAVEVEVDEEEVVVVVRVYVEAQKEGHADRLYTWLPLSISAPLARDALEAPPPPFQGAQPVPRHCPLDGKCQAQWHLQPTVTAPNRLGNLLQPPI